MTTVSKQRATPDLWDRYGRLGAAHKTVMQLKALVWLPGNKTAFLSCLTRTGLRGPDGKTWASRSLNTALDDLLAHKLLMDDLACAPALLHLVAADAMASANGMCLAEAVRASFPIRPKPAYYSYREDIDTAAAPRLLRLAIYANDEAGFTAARDLHDKEAALPPSAEVIAAVFAWVPLAPDWLASRRTVIRFALFDVKVSALLWTGTSGPDTAAVIARYRAERTAAGISPVLLSYDLLAGRLDEVRREAVGADGVLRQALEGAVAFLEARNADALAYYRDALKLHRKQVGKRKVFLDGLHGLLFLLALLGADDAGVLAEAQAGLDAAARTDSHYAAGFFALQVMVWLAQGLEAKARDMVGQLQLAKVAEPLSAACVALAAFAINAESARKSSAGLAERFETLKGTLPLIARLYAEILVEVAPAPSPYAAWLEETAPGIKVAFARLLVTRKPWERALENLVAFMDTASTPQGPATAATKAKRLAWFLDPETRHVEVAEQAARGKGVWTDGRPVAMKRLHERDPRLDYLTEQDRTALRSIRKETGGWYGEESYAFDVTRTIPALVGHPAVFDVRHRSRPLELVHYPLELVVTEQRGGYHIALSHTADEPTVFVEAETPTRYRVVEVPQRVLAVQEILGKRGLTVPASARDQIVALVQRSAPAMPIRADIEAIGPIAMEGIASPVVQLLPSEAGLTLSLVVRPFGADGPAYVAGLGGRSVLAGIGGQQQRATRDLTRELAERTALVEACPTLRDRIGAQTHEAAIDDLEGSLDLLLELQAYTGPASTEWPEGRKFRVSPVTPDKLRLKVAQARDWFSVDGTVALDEGDVLEMRFLLDRLDRAQGRFVPLGDGRFVALTQQLQAQLQRLTAVSEPHKTGQRVHALGVPALRDLLDEASDVTTDAAWREQVARIRSAESWAPKLPRHLQAELRDYQIDGFTWMSRLARWGAGACLADDMGLGKTVQALAVMLDQSEDGPCLVVAPTSVCPNWEAELARFAPTLIVHRFAAAADRSAVVAGLGPNDVLVCSYGLLHQAAALLGERVWQMVVLDEAQAIKNAQTKRARASVALQARFRLALTGTPIENYLDELWSLFNFVNPGLLGSREAFQKRFAGPIERDGDAHARQALRALIRPFLLRRTKAAVLTELPPRTEQTMQVEMAGSERVFYEALRQRALESIAALDAPKGKRKIHVLAEITRLRRACCNPALIDADAGVSSSKLDAFLELVHDLIRNRHRALVFSQFVGHLALVRAALDAQGIGYEYLDGSTPAADRQRRVAAFQSGSADLFLISLRAGGTGLNLTAADYVVHLDPWWNPAVEDQASDRAHRIGQERPVTIYRLIMQDSIEERIVQLHRDKRDLASDLLNGAETAGRLSEDELIQLI
jgi:superfamily II DNA or RNA helicase